MTIPYFQRYNGKRPIVERVPECRPKDSCGRMLIAMPIVDRTGKMTHEMQMMWSFANGDGVSTTVNDTKIAAALTRGAIKCWALAVHGGAEIRVSVLDEAANITWVSDHAEVNIAAHALADALGVSP